MYVSIIAALVSYSLANGAITGLNQPISVAVAGGVIYIAEKEGKVLISPSPNSTMTPSAVLLDISAQVCNTAECISFATVIQSKGNE
jgi:hypothetical protein